MERLWQQSGFLSEQKFYEWLKENSPRPITHREIKQFLESQPAWQLTKQQALPRKYSSWWVRYPAQQYQIDLIVYDRWEIDKYKYIICMIDIYSRYANAWPLTNKNMSTLIHAVKGMIKQNAECVVHGDGVPEQISADNELNKVEFKEEMRELGVKQFFFSDPYEIHHNPIVERFHRTLAGRLQRYRQQEHDYRWYKYLPIVVQAYNESKHSTIHSTPCDVFTGNDYNYQLPKEVTCDFATGTYVRYRLDTAALRKGDRLLWSKNVYVVHRKVRQKYELMNPRTQTVLRRKYKCYELIPAAQVDYEALEPIRRRRVDREVRELAQEAQALAPRRGTRERRAPKALAGFVV